MTRVIALSDTHHRHEHVTVPDGDLLIHAGDWSHGGEVWDTSAFLIWFAALPHANKALIAGNHDWLTANHPTLFRELLAKHAPDVTYLEDSSATIAGLKVWGSPVQPRFLDWAWNRDRGAAIRRHWDLIPDDTDLLITHGPPMGYLDWSPYDKEHCGCVDLLEAIKRVRPRVSVFGHVHGSRGEATLTHASDRCTRLYNASICNEAYSPVNPPHVITL